LFTVSKVTQKQGKKKEKHTPKAKHSLEYGPISRRSSNHLLAIFFGSITLDLICGSGYRASPMQLDEKRKEEVLDWSMRHHHHRQQTSDRFSSLQDPTLLV
jgi:hypothetical protein